jgi:hypothetical protein
MSQSWDDGDARTTPVESDRCVWCKHDTAHADSVPLGDAERICEECVGDLREFKRTRFVDFLVAASLRTSVQNALLAEWADVQSTLAEWHRDDPTLSMLPARDSHDHDGSQSDP